MLIKQKIIALLAAAGLVLLAPISVHAESASNDNTSDSIDFQSWNNVTAIGKFETLGITNPKLANFRWWMEGQGRFGNDGTRFSQAIVRPGLGYQVNRTTQVWLGYAWAPTSAPFAGTSFDEQRIWQQLSWADRFKIGPFNPTFALRTRFEERWVEQWKDPSGDTGYRFRQLARVLIPVPQAPNFGLVLANEIFVHMNNAWGASGPHSGFDQNRAFAGGAYTINKFARAEIGYMNQTLNRFNNTNLMDHILSTNLFLNF